MSNSTLRVLVLMIGCFVIGASMFYNAPTQEAVAVQSNDYIKVGEERSYQPGDIIIEGKITIYKNYTPLYYSLIYAGNDNDSPTFTAVGNLYRGGTSFNIYPQYTRPFTVLNNDGDYEFEIHSTLNGHKVKLIRIK